MKTIFCLCILVASTSVACGTATNEPNHPDRDLPWNSDFSPHHDSIEPTASNSPSSPEETQPPSSEASHSGDSEGEEGQEQTDLQESQGSNHCGIEVECHCCTENEPCYGHGAVECSAIVTSDKGPGYVWFDGMETTTNYCTTTTFHRYPNVQGSSVFHYSDCHPLNGDCLCAVESVGNCQAVVEWNCSE